jgi:predicted AAA+ superfamily ATPase
MRRRLYEALLRQHFKRHRQMVFLSGPRQVGKTTLARSLGDFYLNWDDFNHQDLIVKGPDAVAGAAGLDALGGKKKPLLILDEIHRFSKWKIFLKGLFDTREDRASFLVTGSSRLDVFKRGGDSLMGRYFPFRMHPFSVGEWLDPTPPTRDRLLRRPKPIPDKAWANLWKHGGFPEPFLRADDAFTGRWRKLRYEQLTRMDLRELTGIQELGQVEMLARRLSDASGRSLIYQDLANDLRSPVESIRRWVAALIGLQFGFMIRPWYKNLAKSLRKEPKWYLMDWSGVAEKGARAETMTACHLLKTVDCWSQMGLGDFELCYLRDKEKREVDFVVIRDGKPWFMVEVKAEDAVLSKNLGYFQKAIGSDHAFQAVYGGEYVDADCFKRHDPVVVPLRTLLSQLV